MLTAVVYATDNQGVQEEVDRLSTDRDGQVRSSTKHYTGLAVLNRFLLDRRGRKVTRHDGDEFLKLLPAAYSGARLRVGLEMEAEKGHSGTKMIDPASQPDFGIWERPQPPQFPQINVNLIVPPEAIRVVVEQPAPVVNVAAPEVKSPDVVVNLPEIKFPEIPAPVVNVEVPKQARPVVNIEVPEQPAPIVNVEPTPVTVDVRVPRQAAPVVNVEAPVVNVDPQIEVIVPPREKPKRATITHADGTVSEVEME